MLREKKERDVLQVRQEKLPQQDPLEAFRGQGEAESE